MRILKARIEHNRDQQASFCAQVDALVDHFVRFADEPRQMPVVWHQSLLAFLQRYNHEIRAEDRPPLKELLRKQYHHQVGVPRSALNIHHPNTYKLSVCAAICHRISSSSLGLPGSAVSWSLNGPAVISR